MPFLAAAAPYIGLALTAVQSYGQRKMGDAQKAEAGIAALDDERDANQAQAESQRVAITERKRARYARSRAIAIAGASGSGVDDPTVNNILTGIDTQGEENFMSALYSGDYTAGALRRQAVAERRTGQAMQRNAYTGSAITALRGATQFANDNPSFFSKYGGGGAASVGMGTAGRGRLQNVDQASGYYD